MKIVIDVDEYEHLKLAAVVISVYKKKRGITFLSYLMSMALSFADLFEILNMSWHLSKWVNVPQNVDSFDSIKLPMK